MADFQEENTEVFLESENSKKDFNPKILLGFLTVLTVFALFFGLSNWFNSLKIPFAEVGDLAIFKSGGVASTDGLSDLVLLQQKDTDLDGLSDYDELYLYSTSPYLADTDSDGISDFDEVNKGQNPNCPEGQDCLAAYVASETDDLISGLPNTDNLNAEQIKAMLKESGMSQAEIDLIDDETLMQLYSQAFSAAENSASQGNVSSLNLDDIDSQIANLDFEPSPDQLRLLLKEAGISQSDIDDLSDDDLKALWQALLSSNQ